MYILSSGSPTGSYENIPASMPPIDEEPEIQPVAAALSPEVILDHRCSRFSCVHVACIGIYVHVRIHISIHLGSIIYIHACMDLYT